MSFFFGKRSTVGDFEVLGKARHRNPLGLASYTVATVPAASAHTGSLIYVTNGAAGAPVVAFSNGTNWLRVDSLAAVSAV